MSEEYDEKDYDRDTKIAQYWYRQGKDDAYDTIEAQAAEIARLREALQSACNWLAHAPLESGYCCCGNPIEGHGYGEGHSPVDELAYSARQLQGELRAALKGADNATGD